MRINIRTLKELVSEGRVECISWVETKCMVADCLTKLNGNTQGLLSVLKTGEIKPKVLEGVSIGKS